ncbi:MAG: hypothetical protein AAGM38_13760 [Pseudomonadota bacterium]
MRDEAAKSAPNCAAMSGWRMRRGAIGAASALALFVAAQTARGAEGCGAGLTSACLQSFGAGALPAGATNAQCQAQLTAYRGCIQSLTQQHTSAAPSLPPLSRAERGFLAALEAEFAENVGRVGAFIDGLDLTGREAVYQNGWPPLRLRFFNATDNPNYFIAPADWLAKAQGFYDDLGTYLEREDVRRVFRAQSSSVLYERRVHKEAMQALIATARDELLPAISAELAAGAP